MHNQIEHYINVLCSRLKQIDVDDIVEEIKELSECYEYPDDISHAELDHMIINLLHSPLHKHYVAKRDKLIQRDYY